MLFGEDMVLQKRTLYPERCYARGWHADKLIGMGNIHNHVTYGEIFTVWNVPVIASSVLLSLDCPLPAQKS